MRSSGWSLRSSTSTNPSSAPSPATPTTSHDASGTTHPTPGHPVGLSFCVAPDVRPIPRSLDNIYRELQTDLGLPAPTSGDLTPWAERGVLLLNRVLSAEEALHWGLVNQVVADADVLAEATKLAEKLAAGPKGAFGKVKRMLADWEKQHPGRTESIFSALRNVESAHLADAQLFDFAGLKVESLEQSA